MCCCHRTRCARRGRIGRTCRCTSHTLASAPCSRSKLLRARHVRAPSARLPRENAPVELAEDLPETRAFLRRERTEQETRDFREVRLQCHVRPRAARADPVRLATAV